MSLRALLFACSIVALPASAAAQMSPASGRVVFVGDELWLVAQRWGPEGGILEVRGPDGASRGELLAPGSIACAAGDGGVLVALAQVEPAAVRAVWIPASHGRPGAPRPFTIPRVLGEGTEPVSIALARRPDGFALFWQEGSTSDPNATWRTFEARLDPRGELTSAPRELASVPWPIADVAFSPGEGRYFFLLYYGTGSPEGTRLAAVHVTQDGAPQEHPWWASRAAMIMEAQLVIDGARVLAVYRGGRDGRALLEADVTTGSWARETAVPRAHGTIEPSAAFGAQPGPGALRVERVSLHVRPE